MPLPVSDTRTRHRDGADDGEDDPATAGIGESVAANLRHRGHQAGLAGGIQASEATCRAR